MPINRFKQHKFDLQQTYQQQGAALYFAIVMLIAISIITVASSRNSISSVSNSSFIRLNSVANNAAHQALTTVQSFLATDLRNKNDYGKAPELTRIIMNPLTDEGIFICNFSSNQEEARLTDSGCPGTIQIEGQPDVNIATLTQYHGCLTEPGSDDQSLILKTIIQVQVMSREVRQEVYWKLSFKLDDADCL